MYRLLSEIPPTLAVYGGDPYRTRTCNQLIKSPPHECPPRTGGGIASIMSNMWGLVCPLLPHFPCSIFWSTPDLHHCMKQGKMTCRNCPKGNKQVYFERRVRYNFFKSKGVKNLKVYTEQRLLSHCT